MISTEFEGKLPLRSCNRGEKGDTFDSYVFFWITSHFTLYTILSFQSHLQDWAEINLHGKITKQLHFFICVFLNKEITSYNKNIVQLIFQFGSVNSRNLSPLTELITKTIEQTTSVWRKIGAKPYEVTEPRTSELVNLVFSLQTGIQSANIRFSLINWWS